MPAAGMTLAGLYYSREPLGNHVVVVCNPGTICLQGRLGSMAFDHSLLTECARLSLDIWNLNLAALRESQLQTSTTSFNVAR
jgi:hypothetical protein